MRAFVVKLCNSVCTNRLLNADVNPGCHGDGEYGGSEPPEIPTRQACAMILL